MLNGQCKITAIKMLMYKKEVTTVVVRLLQLAQIAYVRWHIVQYKKKLHEETPDLLI